MADMFLPELLESLLVFLELLGDTDALATSFLEQFLQIFECRIRSEWTSSFHLAVRNVRTTDLELPRRRKKVCFTTWQEHEKQDTGTKMNKHKRKIYEHEKINWQSVLNTREFKETSFIYLAWTLWTLKLRLLFKTSPKSLGIFNNWKNFCDNRSKIVLTFLSLPPPPLAPAITPMQSPISQNLQTKMSQVTSFVKIKYT